MTLPFTAEQFHAVFRAYNEALWPAPLALSALGASAVLLLWLQRRWSSRAIAAILGILWLWSGILYHQVFFAAINPLAVSAELVDKVVKVLRSFPKGMAAGSRRLHTEVWNSF